MFTVTGPDKRERRPKHLVEVPPRRPESVSLALGLLGAMLIAGFAFQILAVPPGQIPGDHGVDHHVAFDVIVIDRLALGAPLALVLRHVVALLFLTGSATWTLSSKR
jgi:hypothetical protein